MKKNIWLIILSVFTLGFSLLSNPIEAMAAIGTGAGQGQCHADNWKGDGGKCADGTAYRKTDVGSGEQYYCGEICQISWCWFCPAPEDFTTAGTGLDTLSTSQMDMFNPLVVGVNPSQPGEITSTSNLAQIVGVFLRVIYGLATVILTVMLVWGGIQIMLSGTSSKSSGAENGKKRIMAAIIGFLITFGSYLILVLIATILQISIPGLIPGG